MLKRWGYPHGLAIKVGAKGCRRAEPFCRKGLNASPNNQKFIDEGKLSKVLRLPHFGDAPTRG